MFERPVVGAFVPSAEWQAWTPEQTQRELDALQSFGINTFVTEAETYRDDLIEQVHQRGMRFTGGIACFMDKGDILQQRPELWPVLETGERRPKMEWYIGLTPTNAAYRDERLATVERILRNHDLDAFCLDFIRWPLHWEQELRPGMPQPLDSSFDPTTIQQFLAYAGLPQSAITTAEQARWILSRHRAEWVDFKCHVITGFVEQVRERCGSAALGAYIVPAPEAERERLVGQRLREMAPLLDFAAPMVYHAILHRPPEWTVEISREVAQYAPVLPVLQVRAADDLDIGADWGPSVSPDEWRRVVEQAVEEPANRGLIAFTSPLLKHEGRGQILAECLSQAGLA